MQDHSDKSEKGTPVMTPRTSNMISFTVR